MNARRLALRVYAFAALLSIASVIALLVLPRYMRGAGYLEPQAALVQYNVERWSLKDKPKFLEIMQRIEPRLRGKLSLYGIDGQLVYTTVEPPLERPDSSELEALRNEKWALTAGRIVVRSDDGSLLGVYHPNRPSYPWEYVLTIGAFMLIVIGAASLWFSRRLARPLGELADAARKFGSGDTSARAKLMRQDELGEVGRAFDDMADRTSAVMSAQRQLMADVSHELRTPLARIRVALELAAEDPVAAKDVLSDVGTDLDEIDQLIGDIMTTARLDGEPKLDRRPVQIADLAERASQRFASRHAGRRLELELNQLDHVLECDAVLLRRAIDNLLDNAAKYSDAATPIKLVVSMAPRPTSSHVAFEIVDHGIGMSPDELERAFTPFWRADGSRTRKTGGVGLGLALARRIARAHGGEVTLTSVAGRGTTARLEVPL
jgi:two-component system, OmpR family, sensor kinase